MQTSVTMQATHYRLYSFISRFNDAKIINHISPSFPLSLRSKQNHIIHRPSHQHTHIFTKSRNLSITSSSHQSSPITASHTDNTTNLEELKAAVKAVRLASHLCQAVQSQLKSAEKVEKDDSSPVTVADYGAQALVAWSLKRSLPHQNFSMVAEEDSTDLRAPEGQQMLQRITDLVNATLAAHTTGVAPLTTDDVTSLIDDGNSQGGPQGRHWVLDPIDGTRGFVGMRQYAVCLGLIEQGEVTLGVLGCPNLPPWSISENDGNEGVLPRQSTPSADLGCIFAARLDCGAYTGPLFIDDDSSLLPSTRIHCNDLIAAEEARYMESYDSRHSDHSLSAAIAEEIGLELPSLRLDSQAKYGALSRGDASIFMRFPPATYREKIWDHCAGAIIVTEAGGCISDAAGNPLDFSKGRYFPDLNGGIVAATPSMHAAIMAALKSIRGSSSSS